MFFQVSISLLAKSLKHSPFASVPHLKDHYLFSNLPQNRYFHDKSCYELEILEQITYVGHGLIIVPWVSEQSKSSGFLLRHYPYNIMGNYTIIPLLPKGTFVCMELEQSFLVTMLVQVGASSISNPCATTAMSQGASLVSCGSIHISCLFIE